MAVAIGAKILGKNEALLPLLLGIHGVAILLYGESESWQWLLVGGIILLGLWSQNARMRATISAELRAGSILVAVWWLMLSTGGFDSIFGIWLLPLVAVYPLLLRPPYGKLLAIITSLAYFSLIPFSDTAVPLLVVLLRSLVLLFFGLLVTKLRSLTQEGDEAKAEAEERILYTQAILEQTPQGASIYQLDADKRLVLVWANQASKSMILTA